MNICHTIPLHRLHESALDIHNTSVLLEEYIFWLYVMEFLLDVPLSYTRNLHCIVSVTDLKTLAIVTMLINSDNIHCMT